MNLLLISNLYPSKNFPYFGTFVKTITDELEEYKGIKIKKIVINREKKSKVIAYVCFFWSAWINLLFNNNDLTYIHFISHSTIPLFFAPKPKKLVLNVHGSDIYLKGKKARLLSLFVSSSLRKADLIVVPSYYYQKEIIEKYNISQEKIFVSPSGGVDTDVFYKKRDNSKSKIRFGYVSRLERDKGWDLFLKAASSIDNINVEFCMVGDGSCKKEVGSLIKELAIENVKRVQLLPQEELANFFNTVDCFIFPSKRESLGLVGLEAMACGCFVIGANNDGILSYLDDNSNGLVFENGNVESLVGTIESYLLMNEKEKMEILNNAEVTVNKFSKRVVIKLLFEKLKNLTEENYIK